jgi:SAM-dependent methyltransferase
VPSHGIIYDSVPAYAGRQDVAFFVEEARRANGPVLELGCGTGRVLLEIARAGYEVVGVDASLEMLERCREKLAAEPAEVRARVTLHRGDAREVELGQSFALVIAPFRVLQLLTNVADHLRLFTVAARHLRPGGHFVFDVYNPDFARIASADGQEHEETPDTLALDGRVFRRSFRIVRVRWLDQVNETELIYYVAGAPGEPFERYVHAFDMRWFVLGELQHLVARGGFEVAELYGSYDRSALTDRSPEIILRARLRDG